MSIRTRVTLVGLGVVTLVLCCFSASLFGLILRGLGTDRDERLSQRADAAVTSLATADGADLRPVGALAPTDPRTSIDIFVLVLDANGSVLSSTGEVDGEPPRIPPGVLAQADRTGAASATIEVPGDELRVHVRPWERSDLGRRGYVAAAQTTRSIDQDRNGLIVLFAISGMITLIAAAIAIWVATGRALRPLRQMAELADEVGRSQDLGRRLPPVPHRDAVGRLTTSFNAMMQRLEEAYRRVADALAAQQRFTADASHELRTPLTTIRNNAEFLLQHPDARGEDREAAVRDIAGESVRMSRLVENLLTLARADGGQHLRREPMDLGEVAEAVCRQASALHPHRTIQFAGTPARPVLGDADALRQLAWILVDNAVKFTPDGGRVWVAVTQRGATVQLTVADNGTGIPPEVGERIFDRFYRADQARTGRGPGWVSPSRPGSCGNTPARWWPRTTTAGEPPSPSNCPRRRFLLDRRGPAWAPGAGGRRRSRWIRGSVRARRCPRRPVRRRSRPRSGRPGA